MAHSFSKILSLCKRRGFLLELQRKCNGQKGSYVYGPLGAELKRNIITEWWYAVVTSSSNVHGIDLKTVIPHENLNIATTDSDDLINRDTSETTDDTLSCVLETAKCMDLEPPFGIAQVGSMFKEGLPSTHLPPGSCDGETMNVQFLCPPVEERRWFSQWQKKRLRWWRKYSRNPERFSLGEGTEEDGASKQQCSIQYNFPWGAQDVESISNRGDVEWRQLVDGVERNETLLKMEKESPSLLSMASGVDRALWAYMCDAYSEVDRPQAAVHTTVLKLHMSLAPYKVAVLPKDIDNSKLCMYSRLLSDELKHAGIPTTYSEAGPLDNRLTLQDELGTPYRVITEAGTLETGIVTLQGRDTTGEEDMNGKDVLLSIQRMLFGARIN
ncbi:glycine--tRNA ligase-like isoform X2 [Halichondria panicea]|uniref:glycine--tRNA ligase-like isoform X2 n=1 Tax=Halichondria panicea TaxID=6063 RepID=UPI00312B5395